MTSLVCSNEIVFAPHAPSPMSRRIRTLILSCLLFAIVDECGFVLQDQKTPRPSFDTMTKKKELQTEVLKVEQRQISGYLIHLLRMIIQCSPRKKSPVCKPLNFHPTAQIQVLFALLPVWVKHAYVPVFLSQGSGAPFVTFGFEILDLF